MGKRAFFAGFGGLKIIFQSYQNKNGTKVKEKTILNTMVSTKKYFGDKKCA